MDKECKGYVPCIDEWEDILEIFHFTTCKEANGSFDAINNVSTYGTLSPVVAENI